MKTERAQRLNLLVADIALRILVKRDFERALGPFFCHERHCDGVNGRPQDVRGRLELFVAINKKSQPRLSANVKALRTRRDAANHTSLRFRPRESAKGHWRTAMACLIAAAEKRAPLMMARVALVQALQAGKPHLRQSREIPPRNIGS